MGQEFKENIDIDILTTSRNGDRFNFYKKITASITKSSH